MTENHARVKTRTTGREAERRKRFRQQSMVLTLLATVVMVDQAAKWWAWRHVPGVNINPGGDFLTGPTIGMWYAHPVTGALLDLLSFGLVSVAVVVLVRRRCSVAVTVCGSLMVGGWASNLLDRLGMHYLTAPGSIRGAVDFISIGDQCWNLADLVIIGTTPLFLLATAQLARRAADRPAANSMRLAIRNSLRARVPAVAAAGAALIMTVALGAADHGSLTKPAHASTCCTLSLRVLRSAERYAIKQCRLRISAASAAVASASARRPYVSSMPGKPRQRVGR